MPLRNLLVGLPAINVFISRILVAFRVPGFPWLWASETLGAMSMMAVRGRVQSIYTLTYGFISFGGFLVESVARVVSAPLAITTSGGIILGFILLYLRPLVQLRPMGANAAPIAK